jgi:hypothetical protein
MWREIQNPLIFQPNPVSFCRAIIFRQYSNIRIKGRKYSLFENNKYDEYLPSLPHMAVAHLVHQAEVEHRVKVEVGKNLLQDQMVVSSLKEAKKEVESSHADDLIT